MPYLETMMSDLTYYEQNDLEKLFCMDGGYVLGFSDNTFRRFVIDAVQINIDDPEYRSRGSSKAKRLRRFWEVEPNHTAGRLIDALVTHASRSTDVDEALVATAIIVVLRYTSSSY